MSIFLFFVFLFTGDPVFCRDRTVPEDHSLRQEGRLHSRLRLPAPKCDEAKPRTGYRVRQDVGGRGRTSC